MGHKFLSGTWFQEAEKILADANAPVPYVIKDLVINFLVKGGPEGDVDLSA